jgi:hypothetical protein
MRGLAICEDAAASLLQHALSPRRHPSLQQQHHHHHHDHYSTARYACPDSGRPAAGMLRARRKASLPRWWHLKQVDMLSRVLRLPPYDAVQPWEYWLQRPQPAIGLALSCHCARRRIGAARLQRGTASKPARKQPSRQASIWRVSTANLFGRVCLAVWPSVCKSLGLYSSLCPV